MKKRIGVLSDLHIGGQESLCPPKVILPDGGIRLHNETQAWLWERWEFVRSVFNDCGGLDALISLGDIVDGSNPKRSGRGMSFTEREHQEQVACDVLEGINFKEFYNFEGSRYHIGFDTSSDKRVVHNIGADPQIRGGYDYDGIIDVDQVGIYCRHSCGVSGQYPGTPLWREMRGHQLNKDQFGEASIFLFGHAHYYFRIGTGFADAINLPCWKPRDGFVKTLTTSLAFTPKIGGLLIEIEDDWYDIRPMVWKLPVEHTIKHFRVGDVDE